MSIALKIENVSKMYRLGTVGTGTLSHDLNRWWAMLRGKEDPTLRIGQVNDRTKSRETSDEQGESSRSSKLATRNSVPNYVWALKDINLEVQEGEILGIIGRNGAGKSTLLKLLSRVTAPTAGSIKARGRIASLLEVGTGFHPELTGRENVYLNGAIMGMTRCEVAKRLDEIVEFSGCAKYIDTPVKRYSSGMTVRLGFAVAAHLECEILIVDEVLAVGDVEFQRKCLKKMREISKGSGKTILFVSHVMESVRALCTKGLLLQNGTVFQQGDNEEIISAYLKGQSSAVSDVSFPRNVSEELQLSRIDMSTTTIPSGSPLVIGVELEALKNHSVLEFAIVLKTFSGQRVAILDLRDKQYPIGLNASERLACTIEIESVPLVEASYLIDIYIRTPTYQGNVENVATLHITGRRGDSSLVRYPASKRGFLGLDFQFETALR